MQDGDGGQFESQSNFQTYKRGIKSMLELLKNFWKEEEGQDLVEYALLLVFIALVVMVALTGLGGQVNSVFLSATSALSGS
jgi:pilus assembly protein Flp/PilA